MQYFTSREFFNCTPSCKIEEMDPTFLDLLDSARCMAAVPFVLLSAYRSSDWDVRHGRSGKGYHTVGRAVDVRCWNGPTRLRIIRACISLGLTVGVYKKFLHIDNRPDQIIFYGESL